MNTIIRGDTFSDTKPEHENSCIFFLFFFFLPIHNLDAPTTSLGNTQHAIIVQPRSPCMVGSLKPIYENSSLTAPQYTGGRSNTRLFCVRNVFAVCHYARVDTFSFYTERNMCKTSYFRRCLKRRKGWRRKTRVKKGKKVWKEKERTKEHK